MFNQIPPLRLLAYIFILGLLPVAGSALFFFSSTRTLALEEERIEEIRYRLLLHEQKLAGNRAVMAHYRDADHFYIDKHLETVTLLEPEIESLIKVTEHKNYTGDETIQKRLEQLTGKENSIVFAEGVVQSHKLYQETTETLAHPVEVNVEDIKKLVALIEGVPIGSYKPAENRPQLMILDLKLEKKNRADNNQTYLLNLKLLKREFL